MNCRYYRMKIEDVENSFSDFFQVIKKEWNDYLLHYYYKSYEKPIYKSKPFFTLFGKSISTLEGLSIFPMTCITFTILIYIVSIALFHSICITAHIYTTIFPFTSTLTVNFSIVKLSYILKIRAFKYPMTTHYSMFEISFIGLSILKDYLSFTLFSVFYEVSCISWDSFNN